MKKYINRDSILKGFKSETGKKNRIYKIKKFAVEKIQELQGVQYQFITNEGQTIADGKPVIFNTLILNNSAIYYDEINGEFTLPENGLYFVDWSLSTCGAKPSTYVSFGIEVIGGAITEQSVKLPICELGGHMLVNVTSAPQNIRLINTTGEDIRINNTCVQANIIIVHLATSQ